MSSLDELIRLETASSGVAFRERAYAALERQGLLRDLIAMANASVGGPRVIFMGVRDVLGGRRKFVGVTEDAVAEARELYQSLAARFVEPPIGVRIQTIEVDGVTVAALLIDQCDDPPYLLKKNVSNTMRIGNGWIRKGTECARLTRIDIQRMFEAKFLGTSGTADIQVGFPGKLVQSEISLDVLPLDELPSQVAGERIRRMLEAKNASQEVFGRTQTRIERLVHAQLFGGDEPYEAHSTSSLVKRLESATVEYEAADRHYELEDRTHKLDVILVNVGDAHVEGAVLVLDFPRMDGAGVVERIVEAPGSEPTPTEGYPMVDSGSRTIRVQASIGRIPRGETVRAFPVPLRVWFREPAAGKTLPLDFTLHGKGLREPIAGTLRVHVAEAGSTTRRARKKKPVTQKVGNG